MTRAKLHVFSLTKMRGCDVGDDDDDDGDEDDEEDDERGLEGQKSTTST